MNVHRMAPIASLRNADGSIRFADQFRLPKTTGTFTHPAPAWPKTDLQIQAEARLRLNEIKERDEVIRDAKRRLAALNSKKVGR
jgi:hypothetical protein